MGDPHPSRGGSASILAILVLALLVLSGATPIGTSLASAASATGSTATSPPPSIPAQTSISGFAARVTSASVASGPGDAIVAVAAIRGIAPLRTVLDNQGDTFVEQAYQVLSAGSVHEELSVWVAQSVHGSENTTVTVVTNVTQRTVLLVEVVSGLGSPAIDAVSAIASGDSSAVGQSVYATMNDLVLLDAAIVGLPGIAAAGGDALALSASYDGGGNTTGAVLDESVSANGTAVLSATLSRPSSWLAVLVALRGPGASVPPPAPHPIWNVVILLMENKDLQDMTRAAGGTYWPYLGSSYASEANFYAVCHPSSPNYLAVLDANPLQCGSDAIHDGQYSNLTLPALLDAHGLSWGGYLESMPRPCDGANSGPYVVRHDPFVYFRGIYDNTSLCDSHVVNSAVFNASISQNHTFPANVSWYVPNQIDNGEKSSLSVCSVWLRNFLSPILNSTNGPFRAVLAHTLFLLAFDESDRHVSPGGIGDGTAGTPSTYDGAGYNGTWGGHVYFVALNTGGYVRAGRIAPNVSEYNMLTTIEWLFNLGNTGGVDRGAMFPPMTSMFTFSSNGY